MSKAFSGLRVIDATHVLAGPFASYQMAVLGADVIKVESPHSPDQARLQGPDRDMNDRGMGTAFMAQGANKKAVAIDLKTAGGCEVLTRLLDTADVFVQNYRPGALEDLGLGFEELSARNPRLICCAISAFGSNGPKREETGYDNILQAYSGIMAMTGHGDGRALKCGAAVVDYATGLAAAFAITAALFQRERTGGKGQFIDLSMLDVAMMLCTSQIAGYTWNGSHPEPKGNSFPFATLGCYRAADHDMMIAASNLSQQRRLWAALGREDLIKDNNNQRIDDYKRETSVLAEVIRAQPAAYWEDFFRQHRVPAARIRRMEEALADPQIQARGLVHTFGPEGGLTKGLGVPLTPFQMSMSPAEVISPPQLVGAQTQEILAEIGFSEGEIDALRQGGAIN